MSATRWELDTLFHRGTYRTRRKKGLSKRGWRSSHKEGEVLLISILDGMSRNTRPVSSLTLHTTVFKNEFIIIIKSVFRCGCQSQLAPALDFTPRSLTTLILSLPTLLCCSCFKESSLFSLFPSLHSSSLALSHAHFPSSHFACLLSSSALVSPLYLT